MEKQKSSNNHKLDSLHDGHLRNVETEIVEQYVFAFIKESHPLRYLASLVSAGIDNLVSIVFRLHKARENPSVETSSDMNHSVTWEVVFSILLLKVLVLLAKPFEKLGTFIEDCLNSISANGGFRQTLRRRLFSPDALILPRQDRYYSFIGFLDSRQDLYRDRLPDSVKEAGKADLEPHLRLKLAADLCVMASKLAYENEWVVKRVVREQWKMHFVGFFDCWNEYLESPATQAFVFTDKERDANAVVVAFRGTQAFNMYDWCTDFDFSHYVLPGMGRVHVGFLEALGLGSRLRKETFHQVKINASMKAEGRTPPSTPTSGLPQRVLDDSSKVLAYDAICAKLREILRKNLGAQLYITGHSLGGALAALFPALLLFEKDYLILPRLEGVFTFGQPRVGDSEFATYMENNFCSSGRRKYFRVVYCHDIVPRVPFDDRLFQFKHFGTCHYYISTSEAKVLHEEPNKNVYSLAFLPAPHLHAFGELFRSLRLRYFRRGTEEDEETGLCLMVRIAGLLTPGICAHNPANYVNAIRLAPPTFHLPVENLEQVSGTWAGTMGGIFLTISRQLRRVLHSRVD